MPVTVSTDLPLHDDRGREWDGDAARAAMASRCADDEGVRPDCMGQGFVWRDADANPATIGAYALPVADVFDGDLHLVLSGVQAAANAVSPAREPGGPRAMDASEGELAEMRSAIERLLARFAREFDDDAIRAPWETETETAAATADTCCCCASGHTAPPEENAMTAPAADTTQRSRVLRASATGETWNPPLDHFANPHLESPTKLTVTADGRVFGHLATWDQPHIGYDGRLVYAPRNSSGAYEYFRQSRVVCADGSALAVGLITMNTGHANETMSADAAASHYDNTGTMVAAVNVGEDAIGIWLAGSMLPDVSPEQRNRFSLARVSGDWRQPRPGSGLELIAALSVPNPGFPVRQSDELLASDRLTLAASASTRAQYWEGRELRTFITAGAVVVDEAQVEAMTEAVRAAFTGEGLDAMKAVVAEVVRAEIATALTAKEEAPPIGKPVVDGVESLTEPEVAPATEGEAAPVGQVAPASEEDAATGAGEASAIPAEAVPAATAEAPPAPAQVAAAALAQHVRRRQGQSARDRLIAAASRSKKA